MEERNLKKDTFKFNPAWLFFIVLIFQFLALSARILRYYYVNGILTATLPGSLLLIGVSEHLGWLGFLVATFDSALLTHSFLDICVTLIYLLSVTAISVLWLLKKCDVKLLISISAANLAQLVFYISPLFSEVNFLYTAKTLCTTIYSLFMIIIALVGIIKKYDNIKPKIKHLWFLPIIFKSISFIMSLLTYCCTLIDAGASLLFLIMQFDFWIAFAITIIEIISIASLSRILLDVKPNRYLLKEKKKMQYSTDNKFYINLTTHVLLTIFTFGIWYLLWVYKTTEKFNYIDDDTIVYRSQIAQLLLCGFVPFYHIYWTYRTAQYIDIYAKKENAESNISTICLILDIFIPIIPPIIMQEKLNAIVCGSAPKIKNKSSDVIKSADELKKYKDLFDSGVITQEEFDAKKKQILDL